MFAVDPAFTLGSVAVTALGLSDLRLQQETRWPWLILIPRRPGAEELEDLRPEDRARLMEETVRAGRACRAVGEVLGITVEKLNVGALGNRTRQLHVHIVGRRAGDANWPDPVWGHGTARLPDARTLEMMIATARTAL